MTAVDLVGFAILCGVAAGCWAVYTYQQYILAHQPEDDEDEE